MLGLNRFLDGSRRERCRFDVAPHLLTTHQAESDLQVGIAEREPVGDTPKFFGVWIVVFLDSPVIGTAGDAQRIVDVLGIDLSVEEVVEQRFELSAVLIGAGHP